MSGRDHLALIHELPCAVTYALERRHEFGVVAHHPESIRDEWSHYGAIPMTPYWHGELHRLHRRGFVMRTKLTDLDLLSITIKLLMER